MVITRHDWRINGDLLEWIATTYPGLSGVEFEACYRLLSPPDRRLRRGPRHLLAGRNRGEAR